MLSSLLRIILLKVESDSNAGQQRGKSMKVLLNLLTENSQNIKKMPQIPRYIFLGRPQIILLFISFQNDEMRYQATLRLSITLAQSNVET